MGFVGWANWASSEEPLGVTRGIELNPNCCCHEDEQPLVIEEDVLASVSTAVAVNVVKLVFNIRGLRVHRWV